MKNITEENNIQIPQNGTGMKVRWTNRRRMAWLSLICIILVTCLILFTNLVPESRLKVLSEVITWFYFCLSSVIGAYMGLTTWASIKGVREERRSPPRLFDDIRK